MRNITSSFPPSSVRVSGAGTSSGNGTPEKSPLSSSTWNDADAVKIASPCWSATTWRAENERPSRSRVTRMIVGWSASPDRR